MSPQKLVEHKPPITGRQSKRRKNLNLAPKELRHQVEEEKKEGEGRARGFLITLLA
jgi:hypothetical protein